MVAGTHAVTLAVMLCTLRASSAACRFHQAAVVAQVFLTPSHLAIAMEYAPGGDLYQHLLMHHPSRSVPEDQARWFLQQLLVGLDYCHRKV